MRALLVSALALLFSSLAARADTITNFNFSSDLTDGYTAQGLVSIDTTDGQVQSSYFTVSQNGIVDATFTQPDYSAPVGGAYLAEFTDITDGYTYELLLPDATLSGYQGGSVCTTANLCLGYPSGMILPGGGDETAVDGTLAPTPEPSSMVFLATGIAAGLLFRRKRSQQNAAEDMGTAGAEICPALPGSVP